MFCHGGGWFIASESVSMTAEVERVDVRLDMALSLLEVKRRDGLPVMPALWASVALAIASLFLAGMVIFGAGNARTARAKTPILQATEAPVAQPADDGNATFQISASRDGLKGDVAANQTAVTAGSEGAR